METINEKVVSRFAGEHPDAAKWLDKWLEVTRAASWRSIQDVKAVFPAADGGVKVKSGGTVTVFDVCGNKYRMIVTIVYRAQVVVILELMTHAEYSKHRWKTRY